MTDWVTWFRYQLQASADGFAWLFPKYLQHYGRNCHPILITLALGNQCDTFGM